MIEDKAIRERYISILSGKKPHSDTEKSGILSASISKDEEEYYLSILRDNNDKYLFNLLEEYELFRNMRTSFTGKEKELIEREIYIENTIKGLEGMAKEIERDIERVNNILSVIVKMAETRLTKEKHNEVLFNYGKDVFYNKWDQIIKRHITETEEKMVRLILLEVEEAMRCLRSPVTCPIIDVIDPIAKMEVFNKPEDLKKLLIIIETIGKDIDNIRGDKKITTEDSLSKIEPLLQKRIKKGYEAIKELERIRGELQRIILDTEMGLDETLIRLDNHIKERFLAIKYNMGGFKERVVAAQDIVAKEMEKEQKRMQNEKR
jgi:hypothetical protein